MTDRINALKTLLTRLIDSRQGYADAIDLVDSPRIKTLLEELMDRRTRNAAELRAYLTREGHNMDDDGSLLASAHRAFMDLKDKLGGHDDSTTIAEIVRGEKVLLDAYETALKESGGFDPEYAFLKDQWTSLEAAIARLQTRQSMAA